MWPQDSCAQSCGCAAASPLSIKLSLRRERDGEMDKRAGNGPRKAICRIHKFLSPWCPSLAEVNASCYLESAFLLALKVSASVRRRLHVRQLPQGLALGATGNWAHWELGLRTWLHVGSCSELTGRETLCNQMLNLQQRSTLICAQKLAKKGPFISLAKK